MALIIKLIAGIVLGSSSIVFRRGIFSFHDAIAWLGQIVLFVMLGLLSFPSRLLAVAWPHFGVLCATALGETVEAAQQQAYRLAEQVKWDGSFYRTDIGYRAIARERGEHQQ